MHILQICNGKVPVQKYGGTERVVWWLSKELHKRGHQITLLVPEGSYSDFAQVLTYNPQQHLDEQIPEDIDIVHAHLPITQPLSKPYVVTMHGNSGLGEEYDIHTIFVSHNHAQRHQAEAFVYNGLGLDDYGTIALNASRQHLLFLGQDRKEKNLKGCQYIANKTGETLVAGGAEKKKPLLSFQKDNTIYKGMVGGEDKLELLRHSKALLFPVLWDEPFGLAMIESLYFGAPVFGTCYGSLPEIITKEVGFLSNSKDELVAAVQNLQDFNAQTCHEYVCDNFSAKQMTDKYLTYYEKVLNGESINAAKPQSTLTKKFKRYQF
ncbi:glycosyltransferase [uncultured Microscilla sp.]|uniref:glycosyltransferase n=1 Tax=uncultured Microscilla sp. TaxID=432653 RepID=UPI002634B5CB|nr:glycosyltransferase [uncultured Microscilla sp.]